MSEMKNARLNDLSPDEFRRLYKGFAIKDARIAELEETLRMASENADCALALHEDINARDARIAELEAALSDVRTILHNEALNQPVNSLSHWVGLYKRIDKLLSQPDREEI